MRKQIENWESDGGHYDPEPKERKRKTAREEWLSPASNRITLLPPFEHKEPIDDDTGLPKHPIYSNYTKYLWKPHRRSGGVEIGGPFAETRAQRR
jgi:hypothetical protein